MNGRNDDQEIIRLFEDGDRALMSTDVREIERIYAEDYEQSDESGKLSTRADLIRDLTSGEIRFLSMKSTGRQVRLFDNFAIVYGSEEDEIKRDDKTLLVKYLYMDVVVRRDGSWQIGSITAHEALTLERLLATEPSLSPSNHIHWPLTTDP